MMCIDVEVELDDESIKNVEALIKSFLIDKEVNHDSICQIMDEREIVTIHDLEYAVGLAVTDVFITDLRGVKRYITDLFNRWDIDPCSSAIIHNGITTKEELVVAVGRALINHIIILAIQSHLPEVS